MKKDLRTVLVAMLLIALSLNSLFAAGGAEAKPQETKTNNSGTGPECEEVTRK
jgi:hypothetical protein